MPAWAPWATRESGFSDAIEIVEDTIESAMSAVSSAANWFKISSKHPVRNALDLTRRSSGRRVCIVGLLNPRL